MVAPTVRRRQAAHGFDFTFQITFGNEGGRLDFGTESVPGIGRLRVELSEIDCRTFESGTR